MSRLIVVAALACIVCMPVPRCISHARHGAAKNLATGHVVGQVWRGGEPTASAVAVHRVVALDPDDPYAPFRAFRLFAANLRVGAGTTPAVATAATDAEGRFDVDGLTPGFYDLYATAPDGAVTAVPFSLPVPGAHVSVRPELPVTCRTVRGIARDADGTPFDGWVEIRPSSRGTEWLLPFWGTLVARTDATGRFVFEGVPECELDVALVVPDRLRYVIESTVPPWGEPLRLDVPSGDALLEGTVRAHESEDPIAGASVIAVSQWKGGALYVRLATDEEGRFSTSMPEGRWWVAAEAPGRSIRYLRSRRGETDPFDLRLARTATVRGRVVSQTTGRPIAGAVVWAGIAMQRYPMFLPWSARTDRSGSFTFHGLPPWRIEVFVAGGGWWSPQVVDADPWGYDPLAWFVEPGQEVDVRLEVRRTGLLEGRVLGPSGVGVPGARVIAPRQTPCSRLGGRFWGGLFGAGETTTDAKGRYRLEVVRPDRDLTLEVGSSKLPAVRTEIPRVGENTRTTHDLALPPARWLRCLVFDENSGEPIHGARIRVRNDASRYERRWLAWDWLTNARGQVRAGPLDTGPVDVLARADGYATVHRSVEIEERRPHEGDVEVVFPMRPRRDVTCRIHAPEEISLEEVDVSVDDFHWKVRIRIRELSEGRFVLEDLPAHVFTVHANVPWGDWRIHGEATVRPDTKEVEIELEVPRKREPPEEPPREPHLRVRVVGPDGQHIASGEVRLHASREEVARNPMRKDIEGGLAELPLPEGTKPFWLSVHDLEDEALGQGFFGPFEVSASEVTVELPPARTLEGQVLRSDGRGIRGVRVTAWDGPRRRILLDSAQTDDRGRFELGQLGTDDVWLRFAGPRRLLGLHPRWAIPDSAPLSIRLQRGAEASLLVLDADGEPAKGAELHLRAHSIPAEYGDDREDLEARGWWAREYSDARGRIHLRGLDPAVEFRLRVHHPGSHAPPPFPMQARVEANPLSVTRTHWTPRDETIRLPRAYIIRGRVVREGGGALPENRLVRYRCAESTGYDVAGCADDGTFTIERVAEGEVRIWATAWIGDFERKFEARPLMVAAGATDVVLVLHEQKTRPRPARETKTPERRPYVPDPPLTLRIRVSPQPDGAGPIEARLWPQDAGTGRTQAQRLAQDGTAVFELRTEDALADLELWIHGGDEGWYVHARGIRAGKDEVVLVRKEGRSIRGRVERSDGAAAVAVEVRATCRGGLRATTHTTEDGSFHLAGLPGGAWRLRTAVEVDGAERVAYATALAGGLRHVVLRPSP